MTHDAVQPAFLPCVEPNPAPRPMTLAEPPFAYIGRALTLPEFRAYVVGYDFGPIAPSQIIIHNTANPDASWAPLGTDKATWWDRDEGGMSDTAIRNKRNGQLDHIRDYYRSLGWDAGPHLFIDERWIWLFTPLDTIGIHAKEGNSYTIAGRLRYTIGVETIGWFGRAGWAPSQQALIRGAVQALAARLDIAIVYKPAPLHMPALHDRSIAFHKDYNKAACPGAAITPAYAIGVMTAHAHDPVDPWNERWGKVATPDQTSWQWAIPQAWKANYQRLGKCIGSALYDQQNGLVIQCFEGGDVRQRAGGVPEVCFR